MSVREGAAAYGRVLLPGARERRVDLGDDYARRRSGVWVPSALAPTPLLGVDLFAGAGGMSCGLHMAGIHVVGASEAWHDAAITYLLNQGFPGTKVHILDLVPDKGNGKKAQALHEERAGDSITAAEFFDHHAVKQRPGDGWISKSAGHTVEDRRCGHDGSAHADDHETRAWFHETYCLAGRDFDAQPLLHLWLGDVRQLTGARILADLCLEQGDLALVSGGPPCQGFSMAGKRQVVDPRNSLVFEFARLVLELKPQTMLMENVPGMVSMVTPEGIPVVDALCHVLEEGGFGGYDALKKSLLGSSGAGGAVRTRRAAVASEEEPDTPADEQLDIFDALGAAA